METLNDLLQAHGRSVESFLDQQLPPDRTPYISDGARYQLSTGGKRLRPALCLITCEALNGEVSSALPFAAATEILHNFLLIHDDIEDGDRMRRDLPTLWVKVGIPNAINVSDYLIATACRLILGSPLEPRVTLGLLEIFIRAFERTVEGQALDINLRGSREVTLSVYHRIVTLKTAYYLALPWVGGALVAGAPGPAIDALWDLGKCLGPAFQIRDDLIDLTRGKGRGGEIGCDLKEGKPSIFYAYVLDRWQGPSEDRERLIEVVSKAREDTTDEDVSWAIELYRRSGALEFAERHADGLIARAEQVIEDLPLDGAGKDVFRAIGRFMVDRTT